MAGSRAGSNGLRAPSIGSAARRTLRPRAFLHRSVIRQGAGCEQRGRSRPYAGGGRRNRPERTRMSRLLPPALLAALVAGVVAVSLSSGSSHREAPNIALDPTADNTDVYAYTADDAPGKLTVVANWIPFEDPAGGPNFYRFDDKAHYYIRIDNTGDGKPDVSYLFKFKTKIRNPNTFLYAAPGVTSLSDPKLNVIQTYSITRETVHNGHEHSKV